MNRFRQFVEARDREQAPQKAIQTAWETGGPKAAIKQIEDMINDKKNDRTKLTALSRAIEFFMRRDKYQSWIPQLKKSLLAINKKLQNQSSSQLTRQEKVAKPLGDLKPRKRNIGEE